MSIAKLDGGITESHGEPRQQHLHPHLQFHSGQLHNGKRVGARGNLHHLRNGGDFGFLERIPENRREVLTGHTRTRHICAVQSFHKRGTNTTRLAQVITGCTSFLSAWKESITWCCTCLFFCCSVTCRLPRAHHFPHSLFLLPLHVNTVYSKNTQYFMNLSRLSQSTSNVIKNHSGVRTCRVAETRAQPLPQNRGRARKNRMNAVRRA